MLTKPTHLELSHNSFSKRLCRKTTLDLKESEETEPSESQWNYVSVTEFPDLQSLHNCHPTNKILHPPKLNRSDQDGKIFDEDRSTLEYDWDIMSMDSRSYPIEATYATAKISKLTKKLSESSLVIGGRQYLAKLKIFDPLGQHKHLSLSEKLVQSQNGIIWNFDEIEQSLLFYPNFILVPSLSFLLQIQMQCLKGQFKWNKEELNFAINANSIAYPELKIQAAIHEFNLEIECEKISDEQKKCQLIEKLNYKVNFQQYMSSNLIKINKIKIMFNLQPENVKENSRVIQNSQIVETLKTQSGSKDYQKQLRTMEPFEVDELLYSIEDSLAELINNEYANYFIQEFFAILPKQNKQRVLLKLKPHMENLVCSPFGTFVFQAFIDDIQNLEQFSIMVDGLKESLLIVAFDQYGSHLVRKLLERMPDELIIHFSESIQNSFLKLCQNKHGVCVVKSYLKRLLNIQSYHLQYLIQNILQLLRQNIFSVIKGEYSNYIIQEICESYQGDLSSLYYQVAYYFFYFQRNKYSMIILTKFIKIYLKNKPEFLQMIIESASQEVMEGLKSTKEGLKLMQELQNWMRPPSKSGNQRKGSYCRNPKRYINY